MTTLFKPLAICAGCALVMHTGLVATSLTRALRPGAASRASPAPKASVVDAEAAAAAARTRATVHSMYAHCTVEASALAPGVVFEDPAMRAEGRAEVQEVFRALKVLSPSNLSLEVIVATRDHVEFDVLQQYAMGQDKPFRLCSRIIADLDKDGAILRLEDRWNGHELDSRAPFAWARRANGYLSYFVTPRLVG